MRGARRAGTERAVALFVAWNAVAVPVLGRLAWVAMERLAAAGNTLGGVMVSLLATLVILGGNVWLCRMAERAGMARPGLMVLWAVTGLTFALTIGTGFFSPADLIFTLLRG